MTRKTASSSISRIFRTSIAVQIGGAVLILIFTNSPLYSIITLLAATVGILGFLIMIKLLDKQLASARGKAWFFSGAFAKLVLIALLFYPVSRISETAVLCYILGLSVVVIATLVEGIYQIFRILSNGRA